MSADIGVRRTSSVTSEALRRVESFQYPRAHYKHLTPEQDVRLKEFKELAAKDGYYHAATADKNASHDDETLLRYLRARKFSPPDAFGQFKDTEDWRKENKIDEVYNSIDRAQFDETRRLYPQWTGRRDKRGIPVYVFEVAPLTNKRMAKYDESIAQVKAKGHIPPKLERLFALYEHLIQFTMPLCSAIPNRPFPDTPVSQSNNIVDISRVGIKQFWNLKAHMQDASQLATAHYPETLDRIFIIGAPSFFPTVWSWIKRWFDPITVSKIFILSSDKVTSTLKEYIDVESIPKKYGGNLDWTWGNAPNLEPMIQNSLTWIKPAKDETGNDTFPAAPIRWRAGEGGKISAVALGTVDGQPQEEEIARLPGPALTNQVLNRVSSTLLTESNEQMMGPPTGVYTHPREDQEYFPASGETPPSTPSGSDKSPRITATNGSSKEPAVSETPTLDVGATTATNSLDKRTTDLSLDDNHGNTQEETPDATNSNSNDTGVGSPETNAPEKDDAPASGQIADKSSRTRDGSQGDIVTTSEPYTVGDAPKNMPMPETNEESDSRPASYMDTAKAAIGSVTTAGQSILAKTGLVNPPPDSNTTASAEPHSSNKPNETSTADPADELKKTEVEDFIRSKYHTREP